MNSERISSKGAVVAEISTDGSIPKLDDFVKIRTRVVCRILGRFSLGKSQAVSVGLNCDC